jgi:predicted RNA-binding Zn ribbon-like protein
VRAVRDALRPLIDPTGDAGDGGGGGAEAARARLDRRLAEVDAHFAVAGGGPHLRATRPAEQVRVDVAVQALPALDLDPARLRRCADPACVLLFHDVSKSGRRRWCDMATCGNRNKAAAHYRRARAPAGGPAGLR